jgi:hypothetical protein
MALFIIIRQTRQSISSLILRGFVCIPLCKNDCKSGELKTPGANAKRKPITFAQKEEISIKRARRGRRAGGVKVIQRRIRVSQRFCNVVR